MSMGNDKIRPSVDAKLLNRSSPNLKHVITSRIYFSPKIGLNPPTEFCPHTREIYTQNLRMFTSLFSVFPSPTDERVGPIFVFNTSYDVVLRKVLPFGDEKNKFKI